MRKSLIRQAIASLCLLLLAEPHGAMAEVLVDYAQRLCNEAGVPLDECTLLPTERSAFARGDATVTPDAPEAGTGNGIKTETLAERGRELCAQQGVDIEDCLALPVELRTANQASKQTPETIAPSYNVPADTVRGWGFFRAPPPMRTQHVARSPSPPAYRYVSPPSSYMLPAYDGRFVSVPYGPLPDSYRKRVRYFRPPIDQYIPPPTERPRERFLYRGPTDERYALPPRRYRDTGRYFRSLDDRNMPPAYMRQERVRQSPEPYFREQERARYPDRFDDGFGPARCLRSIRYSSPPSYRYVACNF